MSREIFEAKMAELKASQGKSDTIVNQNEINGNSVISNILTCLSCNKEINAESTISCKECAVFVHSGCISENGLCQLCQRCADTKEQRRGAKRAQEFQC